MKKARSIQCTNKNESQVVNTRVNRRKILKLTAISTGVALSSFLLPFLTRATAADKPVKMKGTSTGKVFMSLDDGKTWEVAADFGIDCPVLNIRSTSTGFYADIGHKGYRFTLHSMDGLQWRG